MASPGRSDGEAQGQGLQPAMNICGDPECNLPKGHGGHYHMGEHHGDQIYTMWPMATAPEAVKILGRVRAKLPVGSFDKVYVKGAENTAWSENVLAKNMAAFREEELKAFSIVKVNRHGTVEPYLWYGPDPEPNPPGPDCTCQGCVALRS